MWIQSCAVRPRTGRSWVQGGPWVRPRVGPATWGEGVCTYSTEGSFWAGGDASVRWPCASVFGQTCASVVGPDSGWGPSSKGVRVQSCAAQCCEQRSSLNNTLFCCLLLLLLSLWCPPLF
eukprot:758208-Pyramimonas_sp.AAC.1